MMAEATADDTYGCYTTQSGSDTTVKEYEDLKLETPMEVPLQNQEESTAQEEQADKTQEEEYDEKPRQKSKTRYQSQKPQICTRNAVQVLNELQPGLNFLFVREIEYGNCERLFTISVELEGEFYEGTARNKKEAKQEAAKRALLKAYNILCVPDTESQYRYRSYRGQQSKIAASLDPNYGPYYSSKNPVMQLHELHKDTDYFLVGEGYASKTERYFVMGINVCGHYFEASAKNKKLAKAEVAAIALESMYNIHIVPEAELPEDEEFLLTDSTGSTNKRKASDKAALDLENFKYCPDKNALTQLSEVRPYLDFEYDGNKGTFNQPWYVFAVQMDGAYYEGAATTWKSAKYNAAVAALKALESYTKYEKRKNIQSKEPMQKKQKTEIQESSIVEIQESSTLETEESSAAETQESSALETQESSIVETEESSIVETEESSAAETQDSSTLETQESSATETQESSIAETQKSSAAEEGDSQKMETS